MILLADPSPDDRLKGIIVRQFHERQSLLPVRIPNLMKALLIMFPLGQAQFTDEVFSSLFRQVLPLQLILTDPDDRFRLTTYGDVDKTKGYVTPMAIVIVVIIHKKSSIPDPDPGRAILTLYAVFHLTSFRLVQWHDQHFQHRVPVQRI